MTTIYIYKAEEVQEQNITETIDSFCGEDNKECEEWASENYGDTDTYAWSYNEI